MRSRSNSGVRLEYYYRLCCSTLLKHQNGTTGLFHSQIPEYAAHAWVRDNVYAVHAVWALAAAYRKRADTDDMRARVFELEHVCVKVMRALLRSMMMQCSKVESFKHTQSPSDALHAKYRARDGEKACGDQEWGHLQLDATSLFLLTVAQLTASGVAIVYSLDEVTFIQNLVFYIEHAYRTPDFGVWERGDKINHGVPELNASSVGLARAALRALSDLDLFGAHGSPASVVHVMADEVQQCNAVLASMLPRESSSKELDAALLSVIAYPGFAVEQIDLIDRTREAIVSRLAGKYGAIRFLRDGYKTPREDPTRLYYEPHELQKFEGIECEWPLFFCFLVLDGIYNGRWEQVAEFRERLEAVVVKSDDGLKMVPELYALPADKVALEIEQPQTQHRNPAGAVPYLWAQSLYILGNLLEERFIAPAELDPLGLRLSTESQPEVTVQVVVLAEDADTRDALKVFGFDDVPVIDDVRPFIVQPAAVLGQMYAQLGRSHKLRLSGRRSTDVGLLSTSKFYSLDERIFAFTPQFLDRGRFYIAHDVNILIDMIRSELLYVKNAWNIPGRPVVILPISKHLLKHRRTNAPGQALPPAIVGTLKKMQNGYLHGTRVALGRFDDFMTTSSVTRLHFIEALARNDAESNIDEQLIDFLDTLMPTSRKRRLPKKSLPAVGMRRVDGEDKRGRRKMSSSHRLKMFQKNNPSYRYVEERVSQRCHRRRTLALQADDVDVSHLRFRGSMAPESISPTSTATSFFESQRSEIQSPSAEPSPVETPSPATPVRRDSEDAEQLYKTVGRVHLSNSVGNFDDVTDDELVDMLREAENLDEQADLVHYLHMHKGMEFDTRLTQSATVRELLEELYDRAIAAENWWLVRVNAELLDKYTEDAARAVTDVLVRQKQITVGMPSVCEEAITRPMNLRDLVRLVRNVVGDDAGSAALTMEILLYMGMFVRTEPELFTEMLRLRIGLIIQIMVSELARALHLSVSDTSVQLMNLSPFELKLLLHHVLSGKELGETDPDEEIHVESLLTTRSTKTARSGVDMLKRSMRFAAQFEDEVDEDIDDEPSQGHWLRRRRIDGALNRVPRGFYAKIWLVLRTCDSISVQGHLLHSNLTKEMTQEEMKFALTVESVLNRVPEPEHRQLIVEALMVLSTLSQATHSSSGNRSVIAIHDVVECANAIFVQDQREVQQIHCCAGPAGMGSCHAASGLCKYFYDLAPSGRHGTLSYLSRALLQLYCSPQQNAECYIH